MGIGFVSYFQTALFESDFLAHAIRLWAIYLFTHLGVAFVISALIGTLGCEMRAFHDLFSRLTGIATKEHYCPIGPLHPIDLWEINQPWIRKN